MARRQIKCPGLGSRIPHLGGDASLTRIRANIAPDNQRLLGTARVRNPPTRGGRVVATACRYLPRSPRRYLRLGRCSGAGRFDLPGSTALLGYSACQSRGRAGSWRVGCRNLRVEQHSLSEHEFQEETLPKSPSPEPVKTAEELRLDEAREKGVLWRQWGPYLSERQ